ncbi:ECF transporter S component [Zongyangia hominis]|uniref:ECF transporter S component n=1 Tax=Zongyangia hominis TaxID=2763677 RepID=A0A926EF16_9FIRM|nr:ECF transporter S component [Zongyangia hominis]MBC8570969.1 ECF transporter S component [Zongyangia hominis]
MRANEKTKRMVQLSLLIALEVVLALTPLGFIPLGFTKATTMHIPVIIGAILLGPMQGGILGGVFGVCSLLTNTFTPTATSFVFSPFFSLGDVGGNGWSLVICFVPRILIGVVAGYLFRAIGKGGKRQVLASAVSAVAASLTNTILVMGGIYLFFGRSYAAAREIPFDTLFKVIMGVVGINGVPEAIVAAVLVTAVVIPLRKALRRA